MPPIGLAPACLAVTAIALCTMAGIDASTKQVNHLKTTRPMLRSLAAATLMTVSALAWAQPKPLPARLYGVTIDDVDNIDAQVSALNALSQRPIARVVFDRVGANQYAGPLAKIHPVAYTMGELADSADVRKYSLQQYLDRTASYHDRLGDLVDVWEVGNEVNGEWLGKTEDVVAKVSGAWRYLKARGRRTALTLYYNENCWSRAANEMFTWTQKNIPADMKQGLDYVFVSFYPGDCNDISPDWARVFSQLSTMFPNSKLGFGEVGISDGGTDAEKTQLIQHFYGMPALSQRYVGGYFWWYFSEDMVPMTRPLWRALNTAIANSPQY